jgi:hypothetical protein
MRNKRDMVARAATSLGSRCLTIDVGARAPDALVEQRWLVPGWNRDPSRSSDPLPRQRFSCDLTSSRPNFARASMSHIDACVRLGKLRQGF